MLCRLELIRQFSTLIDLTIAVLAVVRKWAADLSKDISSQLTNAKIDTTMKP